MQMRTKKLFSALSMMLIACLLLVGCSDSGKTSNENQQNNTATVEKKEIIISAAASLKTAMTDIEKEYEAKNTGIDLTFNFGSSGSLQKQIENGAPADVFISAGKSQMDALEKADLLASGTRVNLLGNHLVLIVGIDNKTINSFADLKKASKISIGTPESVPAGKYAQEALTNMGLYSSLKAKLVLGKDVTQVLTYVETGNVDAGIVYTSDALGSDKVKVVATAADDTHSPIIYPAAVIASTKNAQESKDFASYLSGNDAGTIFAKYGFVVGSDVTALANTKVKAAAAASSTTTNTTSTAKDTTKTTVPATTTPTPTPPVENKELIISAAASLKNAMGEIETKYETKNTNIKLTFNFGSSGSLQQQIEQGAPADLFISAGKSQMDALDSKSLILSTTRVNLLANDLVLVVGSSNTTIKGFEDLAKAEKISIGTPESVPAGKYAKETLTYYKLWDTLLSKIVYAKDVTQVLTYVESGNVDAGIVYTSDALSSDKVKVVATAPAASHSAIWYPGAVIASTENPTEAKAFLDYLSSSEAKTIFLKYGFKVN